MWGWRVICCGGLCVLVGRVGLVGHPWLVGDMSLVAHVWLVAHVQQVALGWLKGHVWLMGHRRLVFVCGC